MSKKVMVSASVLVIIAILLWLLTRPTKTENTIKVYRVLPDPNKKYTMIKDLASENLQFIDPKDWTPATQKFVDDYKKEKGWAVMEK